MASGGKILPASVAGDLIDNAQEAHFELYEGMQELNQIPMIFRMRPISEMNHGLYHSENLRVGDRILEEREIGEALTLGSEAEKVFVLHKRRFFEKSWVIPDEMIAHAMLGGANARDGIQSWIRERAEVFAEARFQAEQTHAARFFNRGGFTAGDRVFDNSVKGVIADSGGLLMYDGVELFNLTGNARTALSGDTFFNTVALALSATNLDTLLIRVEATNNKSHLGEVFNNTADTLLVPADLRQTGTQILDAVALAGGQNNDANPFSRLNLVVWPFLTDTNGWFVGRKGAGLVWWQGGAPDIKIYEDKRVTQVSFQVEFGAQATEWRHWGASNISQS